MSVSPVLATQADSREVLLDRCRDLASQRSILETLDEDLRVHGFAGSTEVPQLVFLSLYTRILEKPVSLVIKGPSGCGKSFSLHSGLQYIPDAAYEEFHGMSEKALLYLEDLNLKHRYLIIQEAAGLDKGLGRVFLRQLLSEGHVKYATVQTTDDGLIGKRLPVLEGPTGAMMTTTANQLHWEDETRFISVHIDESPERAREALRKQAAANQAVPVKRDLSVWHALHEFVCSGPKEVEVPFAEEIAEEMPVTSTRVQRDFPQVLSLLRACALLHQCTREHRHGKVLATLGDYMMVRRLIEKSLAEGLDAAVPDHIRRLREAVRELAEQQSSREALPPGAQVSINQRRVAEHLRIHPSSVSRSARQAIDDGYLVDGSPGQGRESTLMLGPRELPSGIVLPPPAIIRQAIDRRVKKEKVETHTVAATFAE